MAEQEFLIGFPCFTLMYPGGESPVLTTFPPDGMHALVVFTDPDLLQRHRDKNDLILMPAMRFEKPVGLLGFLKSLRPSSIRSPSIRLTRRRRLLHHQELHRES